MLVLDWRDIGNLLSLAFGLLGLILAWRSYLKQQTAEEAQEKLRGRLLHAMAASNFGSLVHTTEMLVLRLRANEWQGAAELATTSNSVLARATGAGSSLLLPLETDKLEAARQQMGLLLHRLPAGTQEIPSGEDISSMIVGVYQITAIAAEIEGRLRTEADRR